MKGCITIGDFLFKISLEVLAKIFGLADEGLKITWDKYPQKTELDFITSLKRIEWDGKYIIIEGLPYTWPKVACTIMNYFTLDTKITWVCGYHLVIMNHIYW